MIEIINTVSTQTESSVFFYNGINKMPVFTRAEAPAQRGVKHATYELLNCVAAQL